MKIGEAIPLFLQMADYATGQFVKAFVQDADGEAIDGSPVELEEDDDSGLYKNVDLVMPNSPWIVAKYAVYTDDTYETLSESEGGNTDTFFLDTVFPSSFNVVGIIDGEECSPLPIQDTIIKGSDRTITVRLVEKEPTGQPFDLYDVTLIEFRFRKSDGTVLSVKSSDSGTPVQVVSAEGGKILCILTKTQTASLFASTPSAFSIIVTQAGSDTVINLPTQLAVEEKDI